MGCWGWRRGGICTVRLGWEQGRACLLAAYLSQRSDGSIASCLVECSRCMPSLPAAQDPWCVPARADQIQRYYPAATRTDINSGHCERLVMY